MRYVKVLILPWSLVSEGKLWVGCILYNNYEACRLPYASISAWIHPLNKSHEMIFVANHLWRYMTPLVLAKSFGYEDAIDLAVIPCSFHHFGGVLNIERTASSWRRGHCHWASSSLVSTMILLYVLLLPFASIFKCTVHYLE